MAFRDLRGFLKRLEEENELLVLEGADWELELGTINELVAERGGPGLLFDEIKGYPPGYRVATNLFTTERREAIAYGLPVGISGLEMVRRWRETGEFTPIKPIKVKAGPVMENVHTGEDVDLFRFPVPWYHEHDGGRYMGTGCVVVMRDPDGGWVNCGVQRCVLQDKKTLGLHISPGKHNRVIREKYYSRGQNCPVVIAFGPEPMLFVSATLHLPWGISEFDWAGWYRNEPVEVMEGELTGLPFPAYDEIVIEGECLLPEIEMRDEGPFTEWTGYFAGGRQPEPVVKVKAVYHRNNPILLGVPNMKPPLNQFAVNMHTIASLWDDLEKAGIRDIKGVWQLEAGGTRLLTVISIKQDHGGHSKQAGLVAAGCHGGGYLGRFIIVVDDDIDPTDVNDVLWAVATRCDPETAIDIVRGCWGSRLDPLLSPEKRARKDYTHSVAIIDACKPFYWKEEFPPTNKASQELRSKVIDEWHDKIDLLK